MGITRDVLMGSVPPAAISDWRYLAVSLLAGVITFYWYSAIDRLRSPVLVFDAAGLALFAVAGTQKALAFGLNPVMAVLLGMLTGVGGGMMRDLLLAEIPTVLRADLYAMAALAGATVVVIGDLLHIAPTATTIAGALLCFGLRLMAIHRGWHLPIARPERSSSKNTARTTGQCRDVSQVCNCHKIPILLMSASGQKLPSANCYSITSSRPNPLRIAWSNRAFARRR